MSHSQNILLRCNELKIYFSQIIPSKHNWDVYTYFLFKKETFLIKVQKNYTSIVIRLVCNCEKNKPSKLFLLLDYLFEKAKCISVGMKVKREPCIVHNHK